MTPLVDPQEPLQARILTVPLKPSIMGAVILPLLTTISMATLIPIIIMSVDTVIPMVEEIQEEIQVEEDSQAVVPTGILTGHSPLLLWVLNKLVFPYPFYPSLSKGVFFMMLLFAASLGNSQE